MLKTKMKTNKQKNQQGGQHPRNGTGGPPPVSTHVYVDSDNDDETIATGFAGLAPHSCEDKGNTPREVKQLSQGHRSASERLSVFDTLS